MLMLVRALTVSRKDLEFIQRLFTSADSVQTLVDVARAACKVAEQAAQGLAGSTKVRPCSCAQSWSGLTWETMLWLSKSECSRVCLASVPVVD